MSGIWRYLLRENPMQIETTRAIRRFTVSGGYTAATQKIVTRLLFGLLYVLYAWFLVTIIAYKDDMSQGILWFEFGLLTLLIPGSLYAAISGERERMTWDSLILTNLSPSRILVGKLLWRLSLAGIIMLIFLPPLLLTHFVTTYNQAYTLANLLWLQFLLAAWCVFLATFTVYVSAKTKRSVVSLSIVAVTLLTGLVLVPMLAAVFGLSPDAPPPANRGQDMETVGLASSVLLGQVSPLWLVTSLAEHLNPVFAIRWMDNSSLSELSADGWRDFLGKPKGDFGIFQLAPFIYLGLAGLCVAGTLRALARLGMPTRTNRKEWGR